jgi:hypothetical protein
VERHGESTESDIIEKTILVFYMGTKAGCEGSSRLITVSSNQVINSIPQGSEHKNEEIQHAPHATKVVRNV